MVAPPEAATVSDPSAWWMGWLSASVAHFLAGQLDKGDLRDAYREFLRSPAPSPELVAMLRKVSR